MKNMRISVLDQSPTREGISPDVSIRESLDLARACEAFGYHRFWMSEHHSSGAVAGTAPEVLAAAIAATTSRIRVGSAGIMLPHYSALKVAEQFRVLEAIAPGRIDLGVGRAPGSDQRTAFALNPNAGSAVDGFPAQLRDLMAWSAGLPLPDDHPFRAVQAEPRGASAPQIWMLGSSGYGAQVAAWFGLPYCFAYFFSSDHAAAVAALDLYRDNYRPSAAWPCPHAAITVWALAAETEAAAAHFHQSRAAAMTMRDRGVYVAVPRPEAASAFTFTEAERSRMTALRARDIFGTAPQVAARIRQLAQELAVQELSITTSAYDPAVRVASYALLAEEFGLNSQADQRLAG